MGFLGKKQTYIIAEIGSNHQRDLNLAKEHIKAAKEAGADCVKFQSLDLKKLYFNPTTEQISLHERIDMDIEWLPPLKSYCDDLEIDFCSSATYLDAVDELEAIGAKFHKIASAQAGTFPQLIKKTALLHKPVLFSTGLLSLNELDSVVDIFKKAGNDNFTILHCNSIYPTPPEKVGLGLLELYKKRYSTEVGFSDHTLGIHIPIAAVAKGATVIEKHFKIDDSVKSLDAPISVDFNSFKTMVSHIRDIEKTLEIQSRESIQQEEEVFKNAIRYKMVIKRDLKAGQPLAEEDFDFLRVEGGIDAESAFQIVTHHTPARDLGRGTMLQWEDLEEK